MSDHFDVSKLEEVAKGRRSSHVSNITLETSTFAQSPTSLFTVTHERDPKHQNVDSPKNVLTTSAIHNLKQI